MWVPILGYRFSFHILSRGKLGFLFSSKAEALFIIEGSWFMDSSFLSMKPWHPLFDAKDEFMEKTPIWVKLLTLSMEL